MSTDEYLDGVTEHQKHMQDSLNRELAAMDWVTPISRMYVNRVVRDGLLRGNRNNTVWEVTTGWTESPPKIRIHPYAISRS